AGGGGEGGRKGEGGRVAPAANEPTARVFDARTGELLLQLRHDDNVECLAFSPDGSRLATGGADRRAHVFDLANGRELVPPLVHRMEVATLDWSPDGTFLLSAGADHFVYLWNAATGEKVGERLASTQYLRTVRLRADG